MCTKVPIKISEMLTKWLSQGDLHFEYPEEATTHLKDLQNIVDGEAFEEKVDDSAPDVEEETFRCDLSNLNASSQVESNEAVDSDDNEFPAYEIPIAEIDIRKVLLHGFFFFLLTFLIL